MGKTTYIFMLPEDNQKHIKAQLINLGLSDENIQLAMDGRLCDIDDLLKNDNYY